MPSPWPDETRVGVFETLAVDEVVPLLMLPIGLALRQLVAEVSVMLGFGQVHADKFEQAGEALELFGARALGQVHLVKAAENQGTVTLVAEVVAANTDDARPLWQGAVFEGLEQRRHQFAPGQVAGATKKNKVKTHVKNQICPHFFITIASMNGHCFAVNNRAGVNTIGHKMTGGSHLIIIVNRPFGAGTTAIFWQNSRVAIQYSSFR